MSQVPGVGIEANMFMLDVIIFQNSFQSFGGPGLSFGIFNSIKVFERLLKVRVDQAANKGKDAVADNSRECSNIPSDILGGLLSAGWTNFLGLFLLVIRIPHFFPFIEKARIDLANHGAEVKFHFTNSISLDRIRDRL